MIELLVNIDVDDLDRAVAFYTCAFGFEIGRRFVESAAVELVGGSSRVYLLAKATGAGTGLRSTWTSWLTISMRACAARWQRAPRSSRRSKLIRGSNSL